MVVVFFLCIFLAVLVRNVVAWNNDWYGGDIHSTSRSYAFAWFVIALLSLAFFPILNRLNSLTVGFVFLGASLILAAINRILPLGML